MAASIDKTVLALLNGIAKRDYYGDSEINEEFLREELYGEMDETSFGNHLKKFESLVKTMVNSDMDFRQLEAFLTSQMKRREGAITEEQAAAISRFWKNQKSKIHDVVVKQSMFGNKLKQTNWRIDLKTHSRYLEQINTPVAIYELEIEQGKGNKETEKVRFEMDSNQLNETLEKVQKIKDAINAFGS